jgi:hypothetical protein
MSVETLQRVEDGSIVRVDIGRGLGRRARTSSRLEDYGFGLGTKVGVRHILSRATRRGMLRRQRFMGAAR